METGKRPNHSWVSVAACEFMKIVRHLGLRSINQASKELGINYRTLRKLDVRNPDPTLTLEKLMEIWHSLEVFASLVQSPECTEEESRMISDSFMNIVRAFPVTSQLQRTIGATGSDLIGATSLSC